MSVVGDEVVVQIRASIEVVDLKVATSCPEEKTDDSSITSFKASCLDEILHSKDSGLASPISNMTPQSRYNPGIGLDLSASIDNIIQKAKLKSPEAQRLKAIRTLEDLYKLTGVKNAEHERHRQTTARGKLQHSLTRVSDFGKAYGDVLNNVKEAVPYGGGNLAWALLGGLFLVAERKDSFESAISDFLTRLEYLLPRSNGYRTLYTTDTTIIKLHKQLHHCIANALLEAFLYVRKKGWKGSFGRISTAMSIHDELGSTLNEVAEISKRIDAEAMLQMCHEVRTAKDTTSNTQLELGKANERLNVANTHLVDVRERLQGTREQLSAADVKIRELQKQLQDVHNEKREERKRLIKPTLVSRTYNADDVLRRCRDQASHTPTKRRRELLRLLDRPELVSWENRSDVDKVSESPRLIWINEKRSPRSCISLVSLDIIDRHSVRDGRSLVLHSVYASSSDALTPLPKSARTASTVIQEAVYQTLCAEPGLWMKYQGNEDPLRAPSMQDYYESLRRIFDDFASLDNDDAEGKESGKVQIFWLIDRIDACYWRTAKGLSDGPRKHELNEGERSLILRSSKPFRDFLGLLRKLTRRERGRDWEVKVLVTSLYEIDVLDPGRLRTMEVEDEDGGNEMVFDGSDWVKMQV